MSIWSFFHINDTQPGSPRSYRFQPAHLENQRIAYAQIKWWRPDLLLVGGDLTRDGWLHDFEYEAAKAQLDALGLPYHAIPGNMDVGNKHAKVRGTRADRDDPALNMTSENLSRFAHWFGQFPWTFVHKNVRFTGIYAAVAGSGLPEEDRFWSFMHDLAKQPKAEHHVLVMHYALFMDDMNDPAFDHTKPDEYLDWYFSIDKPHREKLFELFKQAGVTIVFSGHIHCRRGEQKIDGIRFYKTPATSFGQLDDRWPDGDTTLGVTRGLVCGETLFVQFVPLESPSSRKDGYGPGGHPLPHERNYDLAWVKT